MRGQLVTLMIAVMALAVDAGARAQSEPTAAWMVYVSSDYSIAVTDLYRTSPRPFRLDGQGVWSPSGYPVWSPAGDEIVFDGEFLAQGDFDRPALFRVDAQTGEMRALYDEDEAVYYPRFSPDGRRLAFIRLTSSPEVAILDRRTGRVSDLETVSGLQTFVGWSPDSERVAFAGENGLVVVNADGDDRREIALDAGALVSTVWSPDGTSLVVAGSERAYRVDLRALDTEPERLADYRTPLPGCACAISFSPDGRRLALPVNLDTGSGVRILDLQTGAARDVPLHGYLDNARFSPDGALLLLAVTGFSDEIDYTNQFRPYGTTIQLLDVAEADLRDVLFIEGGMRVSWPPVLDFDRLEAQSTIFTPTFTHMPSLTPTPSITPTPRPTFTPTPTPIVCPDAPPTRLRPGLVARVMVSPAGEVRQELRVRSAPNGERIASLAEGTRFTLIGSPVCVDGYLWWELATLDGSVTGWSAEGALPDDYFIEPAP